MRQKNWVLKSLAATRRALYSLLQTNCFDGHYKLRGSKAYLFDIQDFKIVKPRPNWPLELRYCVLVDAKVKH